MVCMGYNRSIFNHLKRKFAGSESIERNYSADWQDMFVLTALNGKRNGRFLEIGSNDAIRTSNSYLLESQFGWNGVSIEINEELAKSFQKHQRPGPCLCMDALKVNYEELLKAMNSGTQIDYLSLDIEPATQTLACLKLLPLDRYRFSVITYETDYYDKSYGVDTAERVKRESREIFQSYGYEMVVGNVKSFEDWYVDPRVIDKEVIRSMKDSPEYNTIAEMYMLNNVYIV